MKSLKELFKFVNKVIRFVWKKETSSQAGRLNLIFGIALIGCAVVLLAESSTQLIANFFLSLFNKQQIPELGPFWIIMILVSIIIFFAFCVNLLVKEGETLDSE